MRYKYNFDNEELKKRFTFKLDSPELREYAKGQLLLNVLFTIGISILVAKQLKIK